ncbi:MAG: protein kinase [Chthoniobacter sp.]|nr:protein kinase [Chthoniobacter sp.]
MTTHAPSAHAVCPICAATLPPGALPGHCPRCLVRVSLAESAAPPAEDDATWLVLGDHELREEIARGGMGIVYRAWQRRLGREVAVKVLRGGEFASTEAQARFRTEAAAVARLQHPGIVAIHDFGEESGVLWFSMDLVPGENLAARTRENPLPAREAAECVRRIAEAVQHAHEHGVLHRDLKPSNILLAAGNQPRITDFGIARRVATDTTSGAAELTRTGQVLGSPGYAAPEQALGGKADARTDVYGLGALLYHLLTGRPPFQGPTVDSILLQLRESDPLPPRRLNPTVPRDLETICLHALQKDPARRYATARALGADLVHFLDGAPIRARPSGPLRRSARWCRRHPAVAALLAVVAVLLGALVAGSLSFAHRQERLEHRATLLAHAHQLRDSGLAGSRTAALATLREAWAIRPAADLRSEAIACLALSEITLERTLAPNDPAAHPPEPGASADGRFTLRYEKDTLLVIERATGTERARLGGFKTRPFAQLDDTGRRLAIAPRVSEKRPCPVTLHELPSGKILFTLAHAQPVRSLDWAGELLAVGGDDRFIHIWDTTSGQRQHRFSGHDSEIEAVRFRPDGQELVSLAQDSTLRVWHAARGVEILRLEKLHEHLGQAWWAADGAHLFAPHKDRDGVDVFRLDWPRAVQVLAPGEDEPRSENLRSLTLSQTGDLAAAVDEKGCHVWSLRRGRLAAFFPKDSDEWMAALLAGDDASLWLSGWNHGLRRFPIQRPRADWPEFGEVDHTGFNSGPLLVATRADGTALALTNEDSGTAEDHVEIFQPKDKRRVLLKQPDPFCAALSPDGKWAATGSFTNEGAMLWSLPDGRHRQTLAHPGIVLGTAFTDSGAVLWLWGDHGVQRVSTTTWRPLAPPDERLFQAFTPSPDGQLAASTTRDEVLLHRASDLAEIARLPVPAYAGRIGASTLAFSGDSTRLALHTAVGSVVVWNLPALREELRVLGMDW